MNEEQLFHRYAGLELGLDGALTKGAPIETMQRLGEMTREAHARWIKVARLEAERIGQVVKAMAGAV